jgi:uncharacterized protein YebE (UPF0316 family)
MDFSFAGGLLIALWIFALRVADMTLDTVRVLFVMRGRRLLAWILGIFASADLCCCHFIRAGEPG